MAVTAKADLALINQTVLCKRQPGIAQEWDRRERLAERFLLHGF